MQRGAGVDVQPSRHGVVPLAQLSESLSQMHVGSASAAASIEALPVVHVPAMHDRPDGHAPLGLHGAPAGAAA
jgi:hypothetical protein